MGSDELEPLSEKEKKIIGFVLEGLSNRQIGEKIGFKKQTVNRYLMKIYDKTGTDNRLHCAIVALKRHLL